jgi:hypothetical protein
MPWSAFFDMLEGRGHRIVQLNEEPEMVIFMNHHKKLHRRVKKLDESVITVLILWEPRVTRPENYREEVIADYDAIFTPSESWITGPNVSTFNWPQGECTLDSNETFEWNERSDVPVVVQSNKFSFVNGEMYSLRREIVKRFGHTLLVYGSGWQSWPKTGIEIIRGVKVAIKYCRVVKIIIPTSLLVRAKNYGGVIDSKHQQLRKHKYAIVVENSLDYVSEKLFEAVNAGCCVFYVGPKLKDYGIPEIAFEVCSSSDEILRAYQIALQNPELVQKLVSNAREFLSSNEFVHMKNHVVLRNLAETIDSKFSRRGDD